MLQMESICVFMSFTQNTELISMNSGTVDIH
jgi:hypothetical protein